MKRRSLKVIENVGTPQLSVLHRFWDITTCTSLPVTLNDP